MGQREETDFLAVSLSATDYIGHQFGTNAIETEDTYLRLDQDLGLFFEFLDEKIGRDHYTVFLTADHAAAHNVGFLQSHRIPSDSWLYQKVLHRLDSTLNNRFAVQGLVYSLDNYQVHLDRQLISRSRLAYENRKVGRPGLSKQSGRHSLCRRYGKSRNFYTPYRYQRKKSSRILPGTQRSNTNHRQTRLV